MLKRLGMTKLSVGASFVFLNPTACFYPKVCQPAHGHINQNELTLCIFKQSRFP